MFKKRIQSWGLSKTVKSTEKDRLIAELIQDPANTNRRIPIRHDKLIRHAKRRVNSGQLDLNRLSHMQTHMYSPTTGTKGPYGKVAYSNGSKTNHLVTTLTHSPPPTVTDTLAPFHLFLRSLRTLIRKEATEFHLLNAVPLEASRSLTTTATPFDQTAILHSFMNGIDLWRTSQFTPATAAFAQAAQLFTKDLQDPSGTPRASRMTAMIGIPWSFIKDPVFRAFGDFMARAAAEHLGAKDPLSVCLKTQLQDQGEEEQYRVWECARDGYLMVEAGDEPDVKGGDGHQGVVAEARHRGVLHLYGLARQRWLYCRRNNMPQAALWYRNHAAAEMRKFGFMTEAMERQVVEDLKGMPGLAIVEESIGKWEEDVLEGGSAKWKQHRHDPDH